MPEFRYHITLDIVLRLAGSEQDSSSLFFRLLARPGASWRKRDGTFGSEVSIGNEG